MVNLPQMSKLQAAAPCCEGKQKMTTGELHWVALAVFVALLLFRDPRGAECKKST
jgi:hypothetical protein